MFSRRLLAGFAACFTLASSARADAPSVYAGDTAWGGKSGLLEGDGHQFLMQLMGIAVVGAWCGGTSFVILKVIDATIGLRVTREQEIEGLDYALHGEEVPY